MWTKTADEKEVSLLDQMLDALKSVDVTQVNSIARVKVQNAILRAESEARGW